MAGENDQHFQAEPSDIEVSEIAKKSWQIRHDGNPDEDEFALSSVSFIKIYSELSKEIRGYLHEKLSGKPLIDLGSGTFPDSTAKSFINKFGISKYIGVDIDGVSEETQINGVPVSFVSSEALAFLLGYEGKANIMSNGFLCSEIVGRGTYSHKIFRRINEVISPGGVLIATHFDLDDIAKQEGLTTEEIVRAKDQSQKFVSYKNI